MLMIEDNLLDSWAAFDELNKFKQIKHVRY